VQKILQLTVGTYALNEEGIKSLLRATTTVRSIISLVSLLMDHADVDKYKIVVGSDNKNDRRFVSFTKNHKILHGEWTVLLYFILSW
jgi:hypothetical protein